METAIQNIVRIAPQPGPQTAFLQSSADIAIFGGAAGGGKSYGVLLEPIRHFMSVSAFGGVVFRRTSTQFRAEGSLWDISREIYPYIGGDPKEATLQWKFPNGSKLKMAHLQYENDVLDWQGAQIPYIGFDELTHFTEYQFFYMLSRSRSLCGVKPYIRATCNPDPDSFVAEIVKQHWVDKETGYAIPERSGDIKWFLRIGDELRWSDSRQELIDKFSGIAILESGEDIALEPKSITFIPSRIQDNKILMQKDPGYIANLMALPRVERERLLGGNWNIRPTAGDYFKEEWFEIVDQPPTVSQKARGWDRAATKPSAENRDPDWTAGVLMSQNNAGTYFIEDVCLLRDTPRNVKQAVLNMASQDGFGVWIALLRDPAQAGIAEIEGYLDDLGGYLVDSVPEMPGRTKEIKAATLSVHAEAGNIKILRAPWNKKFISELVNFPIGHDDQLDGMYAAFMSLNGRSSSMKSGGWDL